jgi:hypothetical protein
MPAAPRQPSPSTRLPLFQEAAQRSGIPLPILVGLAWEQSFLSDHGGRPSIDGGFGLLDLSARSGHDTLDAAARLVHASPSALRRDDALNLLGGALLLARYERDLIGALPSALGAWTGAIARFTGMRSRFTARLVVDDLYRSLRRGIAAGGLRLPAVAGAWPRLRQLAGFYPLVRTSASGTGGADYPGAVWEPASAANYSAASRPHDHAIRYIVIHDAEGSCAATVNWFQNSAAQGSAHYVVCLDGTVIQTVPEHDIAWHAGNWPINQESIGIEHEGYRDHPYYTRAQYLASAALVHYLCHKYGLSPNRNVIFGHENVPAADHTDPGPYWNWSFYMQRVRHDASGYEGGTTGVSLMTGNASVYSCPKTSCAVLGSANWGEQFAIVGESPGWGKIDYAGQPGWLPATNVAAGSGYLLRTTAQTTLRAGPSAKDSALATVPTGQRYVSVVRDGAYWYIAYAHRYGFLYTGAVQATDCRTGHITGCLAPSGSSLAVVPNEAPAGTNVSIEGIRLAPDSPIALMAGDQSLGDVQTDGSGSFAMTVTLPSTLPAGDATISATDPNGTSIQTGLRVLGPLSYAPHLTLSQPVTGPGKRETIGGNGLPPETAVTITASFPLAQGGTKRMVIHTFSQPSGVLAAVRFTVPSVALPGVRSVLAIAPGVQGQVTLTLQGAATATPTPTAVVPPTATRTATPTPTS